MISPSQMLQDATKTAHQRLENLPALQRLLTAEMDMDHLGLVYDRMHEVYGIVEGALVASALAARTGYRPRLPLLRRGLEHLNRCTPHPAGSASLFKSTGRQLGAMYVLEGAILGGRTLHKALSHTLTDAPPGLLDFFTPYGEDPAPHWKKVQTELNSILGSSKTLLDEAMLGAILTFALFHAFFTSIHINRG